jgi:hypothetical protein
MQPQRNADDGPTVALDRQHADALREAMADAMLETAETLLGHLRDAVDGGSRLALQDARNWAHRIATEAAVLDRLEQAEINQLERAVA